MTEPVPAPAPPPPRAGLLRRWRVVGGLPLVVVLLLVLGVGGWWLSYRFTHSITEDAFVEAHIVNIGPQQVTGHIVEIFVQEDDRVQAGQLLCRLDPRPYRDEVELRRSRMSVAQAELAAVNAALARLEKEVPRRIAIAEKEQAFARAEEEKAGKQLELTREDVDKAIRVAQSQLDAAKAVLVNAEEDYRRFGKLFRETSVPERRFEEATRTWKTTQAEVGVAQARLERALANRTSIEIDEKAFQAARHQNLRATEAVALAETGLLQIDEAKKQVAVRSQQVAEAGRALALAETNLAYTAIKAPFPGVIVKRFRHLGDFAPVGTPILSMYDTELTYVTANLEETRLLGVAPGNRVRLDIDAFREPFEGRVLWIGKATGANFALVPRDVSAGEFTRVVQRVPVRIWIDRDDRWPLLRAGLSVTVAIEHGAGDPAWANQANARMLEREQEWNRP